MSHVPTIKEVMEALAESERLRQEAKAAQQRYQDLAAKRILLPKEMNVRVEKQR